MISALLQNRFGLRHSAVISCVHCECWAAKVSKAVFCVRKNVLSGDEVEFGGEVVVQVIGIKLTLVLHPIRVEVEWLAVVGDLLEDGLRDLLHIGEDTCRACALELARVLRMSAEGAWGLVFQAREGRV